jgi:hypothetical protein
MRYFEIVKETSSSGGTCAGSVATVVQPLFKKKVIRRVKEVAASAPGSPPTEKALIKRQP